MRLGSSIRSKVDIVVLELVNSLVKRRVKELK
jgi:hypothetical protein